MTLAEVQLEIESLEKTFFDMKKQIASKKKELLAFSPVRPGWIIEDGRVRIRVEKVDYNGEFWSASGPMLTNENKADSRSTASHSIKIVRLDGPRNTVKVIESSPAALDAGKRK